MTSVTVPSTARRRLTAFRAVALLTRLVLLLAGLQAVLAPWFVAGATGDAYAESHRCGAAIGCGAICLHRRRQAS